MIFITPITAEDIEVLCNALENLYFNKLHRPNTAPYEKELLRYWSVANTNTRPPCIFQPTLAAEVSEAVKLISKGDVLVAIKSGGHTANDFASTDEGLLIALGNMDQLDYRNGRAFVGPGGRWSQVIEQLDKYNVTVVGGRIGNVGVGGLLLGGGLSFLSPQYGLAAENVLNYQVVLADGSIVNANECENPELFFGLKGGGNQLGIVTEFTLKTYPIGLVYGGVIFYHGRYNTELLEAFETFRHKNEPKGSIVLTFTKTGDTDVAVLLVFFDGTDPGTLFEEFINIESIKLDLKIWKYAELLKNNDDLAIAPGLGWVIRTITYHPSPELLQVNYRIWNETTNELLSLPNTTYGITYHLLPASISNTTQKSVLDLESVDLIWIELANAWRNPTHNNIQIFQLKTVADAVEEAKLRMNQHNGYLPLYSNDAWKDQPVLKTLKGYNHLKKVKQLYDPHNFWDRTRGFRI
ncbi:putative FAD-linked oxidoreductase [Neolecta irregularis DAH-3]|uniref:Putative FAD-linked oxidoreductase n=1 Tax=Neolecta irregularis (strain DAH-3) TaxID=1198029 RepID=A0A1U7LPW4_NEOID|nr:putative FAD-linked oxidoreductase [Neolecta irregularis DAH-3]|eukprot:OLL24561.1 putative FAD-linked oxidoreductase [Neolecta irregularis DAH-3]